MKMKSARSKRMLYVTVLVLSLGLRMAQGQISSISPNSATQGTTGLTVTITLDADTDPPLPPAEVPVERVMIGTLSGTSVNHVSETVVTAEFDIPAGEGIGLKDVSLTFSVVPTENQDPGSSGPPAGDSQDPTNSGPPQEGQSPTFTLTGGFAVTAMPDTAPTILTQPQSKTVRLDNNVTLTVDVYGSEPMTYQWQKDDIIIEDANSVSYSIVAFTETDAGEYRCFVSNEFGWDLSEAAELTADDSLRASLYPIVDTGQTTCYDDGAAIVAPLADEAYFGQDAQYAGNQPSYTDNGDGTVTDNVTGLMWQQSPDTDGDGDIDAADKYSHDEAVAMASVQTTGGYTDWRLPTIKELYSLMNFNGTDPRSDDTSGLTPFVDANYFDFAYGDTEAGERIIDSQYASSTLYVSNTDGDGGGTLFGLNLADGRIKGYGLTLMGCDKTFLVLYVRGNTSYGQNLFVDNNDLTVTDEATSLMWSRDDSGESMNWQAALAWVQARNAENYLGYSDWRLPNVKELHSLVDYTRSPDTTDSAAMDPIFNVTQIVNEASDVDYPWFWSSTTHAGSDGDGSWGAYVAFGRALGYNGSRWVDVHGAGCQRSDPKSGDFSGYLYAEDGYYGQSSPQGDGVRIYNYVRLVRDAGGRYPVVDTGQTVCSDADGNSIDPPAEGEAYYGQDAQFDGAQPSFTDNGDGTVTDNVTGLMWQKSPDSSGFTWLEALDYCDDLVLADYNDWRLPTTKELFSISDFSQGWPYLDTDYFDLAESGEVTKDEQFWADYYVGVTVEGGDGGAAFGVNHATGHIKAYAASSRGPSGGKRVRAVRGGTHYGVNDFVDNGDGTVTDRATGLMWQQADSGVGMDWPTALAYAEDLTVADYNDWRLPNVKELQSIVSYTHSPSASNPADLGPAIDTDYFDITMLPAGTSNYDEDYGYFWTSTNAYFGGNSLEYYYAWYVAFGTAVDGSGSDSHGAGGVRFDTKVEGGPLGEGGERYYNYVRCIRDIR